MNVFIFYMFYITVSWYSMRYGALCDTQLASGE